MTTGVIGEKAAIFNYGFLSVKTSKLLNDIGRDRTASFSEEDYKTIEKAEHFLSKIMEGQKLMSGEREGFIPSSESVEAVSYALHILGALQDNRLIEKIEKLSEIKSAFQNIHEVLVKIGHRNLAQIHTNHLELSSNFFLWLSRTLVSEAQEAAKIQPRK